MTRTTQVSQSPRSRPCRPEPAVLQHPTPVSPAGDILSRLSADTTQVSDLISQNVNIFLRSVVKGAGFFAFMCAMSWKLSLVTVTGFPFIAFVSKVYGDYYKVKRAAAPAAVARRSAPTEASLRVT